MAEGGLHERYRGAAVERMAGVGVAEPVRRGSGRNSCLGGGLFDDTVDLHRREMPAFVRSEHRIPFAGVAPERAQLSPDPWGEQNDPGLAAFAEYGDLAGILARLQIAPGERAQLGDTERPGIKQP